METVDITKMWEANKSPLVTGITLCYNKLDFCQPAIESLAAWNGLGDEFEYVVWDNGSPYPGVAEYVEALKGRDGIEVMGGGFNVGVGAGLNRVIENTDSEFVFKFDDDCTILPWTLPAMPPKMWCWLAIIRIASRPCNRWGIWRTIFATT